MAANIAQTMRTSTHALGACAAVAKSNTCTVKRRTALRARFEGGLLAGDEEADRRKEVSEALIHQRGLGALENHCLRPPLLHGKHQPLHLHACDALEADVQWPSQNVAGSGLRPLCVVSVYTTMCSVCEAIGGGMLTGERLHLQCDNPAQRFDSVSNPESEERCAPESQMMEHMRQLAACKDADPGREATRLSAP
jgi:hypothetical protein